MINSDDIEAFTPDEIHAVTVADVVIDRTAAGATAQRRIMADEELPVIHALAFWKALASRQAEILADLHRRQIEGMDVAPDQHRG